ncbi:hypothetical protein P153DRAFT_391333 [Dothidotthia symphoricarpi CBS 119687]|uniref:Uncharacterized protein n=1 Tax=Dothidotthia symphoricarpi CBS 119687 TaxID=1392245 RepID=A0A6A5ZWD4_9PLEO|nr:uncharacterized protein P153DRAFT_391333 [Dothidotthia symphoricarpi CBS 119687]KAF2123606.1 hypothetical protein P153DRAFT_391333 [Dothidotthia symphoricarpi CBS 119687]
MQRPLRPTGKERRYAAKDRPLVAPSLGASLQCHVRAAHPSTPERPHLDTITRARNYARCRNPPCTQRCLSYVTASRARKSDARICAYGRDGMALGSSSRNHITSHWLHRERKAGGQPWAQLSRVPAILGLAQIVFVARAEIRTRKARYQSSRLLLPLGFTECDSPIPHA